MRNEKLQQDNQKHEQICFENERKWYSHAISYFTLLPAFVDADNSQNSEAVGEIVEEYRISDCYLSSGHTLLPHCYHINEA
jgi:hypothetical protein